MMKRKLTNLFFALMTAAAVTACGSDDDDEPGRVDYATAGFHTIVIAAGESDAVGMMKFTTTGDWTAEIYPSDATYKIIEDSRTFSRVDWLEVVPFQGGAGDWSPQMFLKPNTSADSRYAVIVVNSIFNSIRFNVCQTGTATTPDDGNPTTPVTPQE